MYRPRVVISRCINIEPVRYNGGIVNDHFAKKLGEFVEYVDICPEVDTGMPVPRPSVILAKVEDRIRMIEPLSRTDYTEKIEEYSVNTLNSIREVDGFLLKSKSPSCGVGDTKLYKDDLKHQVGKTNGIFADYCKKIYPYIPVEDEGRVHDEWIRRDFLTRIFTYTSLRHTIKNLSSIRDLIKFHQNNKYLLMLYSPYGQKKLGQLLANWEKVGLENIKEEYKSMFYKSLSKRPTLKSHVNVVLHIYGHFSDLLKPAEKRHIHNLIDKTLGNRVNLNTLIEYIRGFVYRFDDEYLMNQTYLNPYPAELQ
ncbi:MAG: DUF523 and DUF1722 domain-containing protein [Hydrogenothermaceae bacterium]|nr:DUF523 and DUF1722 domain-containing protein [Hydrogenothermaceae bacterium]